MAIAWGVLATVPALAQQAPIRAPLAPAAIAKADPQEKVRYQIAVMESVLETAVQRGAAVMTRQWRSVAPEMLLIGGTARARGFRLDGYGVFFVVDVPAMRQSGASTAVQAIRNFIKSVSDPTQRRELEQAIRRLEIQVSPYSKPGDTTVQAGAGAGVARSQTTGGIAVSSTVADPATEMMADPGEAYTSAVKDALIEVMLDYSQALPIGAEESLTVAARDNNARGIGADDEGDAMTIFIRIKGADLNAMHAGRITRDEARKRVEVREY
jgi:hypothetical protein